MLDGDSRWYHCMKVDEKGELKLSNFRGKKTTYSDHNTVTLNCIFKEGQTQSRHELFNFKNPEGQTFL